MQIVDQNNIRHILVVDDEPNIVSAVQRELASPPHGRYRYQVTGCTDPLQALAKAREQSFDAVISDYRMPDMDGLEFLKELTLLQPECARLVLSGQTDMATLIRMVNETHIYRFIPKPWHDYYLKSSLAQAIGYHQTLRQHRELAAVVRQRQISVPPLPEGNMEQILIVDHDPGVLGSLSRVLTHHSEVDDLYLAIRAEVAHTTTPVLQEGKISVQVTPSARHALELVKNNTFSCIIADRKMPEMDGVELLQRFADLQPDCFRILISNEICEGDLIQAIGGANIFAFIQKPWSDFELKNSIAQALAQRRMLLENRQLAEIVQQAGAV